MKKVSIKSISIKPISIKQWHELKDRKPEYALVADVDLVVVRTGDTVSVLYGRCAHRGALMSDGHVDGNNLICGVNGWDYRIDNGISEYNNSETLHKFNAWVEDDQVWVACAMLVQWGRTYATA
jgi:nitrite reductase/ring-hydroxylating ferredoxin subunit